MNNLREKYSNAFKIIDDHMRNGKFDFVAGYLNASIDSDDTDFATGVIRFCSCTKEYIPQWNHCLESLKQKWLAKLTPEETERKLRGLTPRLEIRYD